MAGVKDLPNGTIEHDNAQDPQIQNMDMDKWINDPGRKCDDISRSRTLLLKNVNYIC